MLLNPAGLTGIWAEENTRDALFDALRRRETFATSGVRLAPRLFGGWDLGDADLRDLAAAGYRRGVPMGAELPARPDAVAAPTFLAYAAKDALGANLDRIQIVKCWTDRGMLFEKVYDVAASGGRVPGPHGGALLPVGDTVDVSAATYRNDIGAAELSAAWTDPDFDPSLACVYYARILEIPTPRWSTYDAVKHGKPVPANVPASVQQRAWTSPVWYTPGERDRADRPAAEGMYTVAQLADRGIGPMTDDQIRAVTVGRTGAVGEPHHRVRGHPALRRGRQPVADGPGRPPGRHPVRDPRRPAYRDHAARRTDGGRAVLRRWAHPGSQGRRSRLRQLRGIRDELTGSPRSGRIQDSAAQDRVHPPSQLLTALLKHCPGPADQGALPNSY